MKKRIGASGTCHLAVFAGRSSLSERGRTASDFEFLRYPSSEFVISRSFSSSFFEQI